MKYQALIHGETDRREVTVERTGPGRYSVLLGDERHEVDALTLPHGAVSLLIDGHSYSVELDPRGEELHVFVKDHVSRIDVANERQLRLRAGQMQFSAEGRQVITSPMPGKVVKLLVSQGDEVAEGQGLVVVEAMKMENELKSPKAGVVAEILAQEGVAVEANARLVVVE